MMMPIIAKFALVLVPPSPRLLIRVKNAFSVYLMVKRYFSLSYFIMSMMMDMKQREKTKSSLFCVSNINLEHFRLKLT